MTNLRVGLKEKLEPRNLRQWAQEDQKWTLPVVTMEAEAGL
jgi:hypothetical protein